MVKYMERGREAGREGKVKRERGGERESFVYLPWNTRSSGTL